VISVQNYVRKECTQLPLPFLLCCMSAFTAVKSEVYENKRAKDESHGNSRGGGL
jgi:hypothetical protein